MVTETKVLLDQLGDARLGPGSSKKAVSLGTLLEQAKQLLVLLVGQAGNHSRCRTRAERLDATRCSTSDPAADSSLVYAQGLGDARLAPALLMQLPARQPAAFFPIVWYAVCRHASDRT